MKTTSRSILKKIKSHERWLNNGSGKRADFSGEDLSDMDFSGSDLRYANFQQAIVDGASFEFSNLSFSSLYHARAFRTNFSRSSLCMTVLDYIKAPEALFHKVDFSNSTLVEAYLYKADLSFARFVNTNMKGACIKGAKISWFSRELISHILTEAADMDINKRKISGLILISDDLCWGDFLAIKSPLKRWVIDTLLEYSVGEDLERILMKYDYCYRKKT